MILKENLIPSVKRLRNISAAGSSESLRKYPGGGGVDLAYLQTGINRVCFFFLGGGGNFEVVTGHSC